MFGIVRRKKPYIHSHYFVPLESFRSDTEQFYKAVEAEVAAREIPNVTSERVEFQQGGWFSGKRTYLRLTRERVVLDLCSAPFGGIGWFFSVRVAELPRRFTYRQIWAVGIATAAYLLCLWQLYGVELGGIIAGCSLLFLVLLSVAARAWGSLDEALAYLPVVGIFYEALRRDTYQQQDHRQVYAEFITRLVRGKIEDFCAAGGVSEPEFIKVNSPDQVLTETELAKYSGTEEMRK